MKNNQGVMKLKYYPNHKPFSLREKKRKGERGERESED